VLPRRRRTLDSFGIARLFGSVCIVTDLSIYIYIYIYYILLHICTYFRDFQMK
jgi:hypothetical protein